MSDVKYTELDFLKIKENLKTFLKAQEQFKDYNFDGSSLSMLLDVLAYNTSYNAFYLNMVANEMFLDSTSMRDTAASRAKHLGYVPRSAKTLEAEIDLIITYRDAQSVPAVPLLTTKEQFYITADGVKYTFYPKVPQYLEPYGQAFTYIARNVKLVEGKKFTHKWTVDKNLPVKQRFVLDNNNVDINTIRVSVQKSATNSAINTYQLHTDLNELKSTDYVYFIQPYDGDKYEVLFGDGILGRELEQGNVVSIEYLVSSGPGAVGGKVFRPAAGGVGIFAGSLRYQINVITPAKDYVEPESLESIKFSAPRSYTSQNRAVTRLDYETLLKKDIPTIEHLRVWGGEDNDPPMYGKIFCAIKPTTGFALNVDDRKSILDTFIKPRNVLAVEVVLVDPEYIGLILETRINYFSYKTTKSEAEIKAAVLDKIREYKKTYLVGFDSDFRLSKLSSMIDSADPSIESNVTQIKLKYLIIPSLDLKQTFEIKVNNAIDTGDAINNASSISSDEFLYNGQKVALADNGSGTLYLYHVKNGKRIVINENVGSVSYSEGTINVTDLVIDNLLDNKTYFTIYVVPKEPDIIALRNQILILDELDIKIGMLDLIKVKLS